MTKFSRRISPFTLFIISINGIVGSGWLLAPFYAATIAGPASLISWVVGGLAVILVAFTFAELSTMLPVAGGTARIPYLSHGQFASFILGWLALLSSILMAPVEVQAVLLYASFYFPSLLQNITGLPALSLLGKFYALLLLGALSIINVISYRVLMRANLILTIFKFSIILFTIYAIFSMRFNMNNFSGLSSSIVSLHGWQSILSGIATGGILLAFNGFKSGIELAGETKNLSFAIPLSTVGAVATCLFIYLGLQITFIGALDPSSFNMGWNKLSFTGDVGPFLGLALGLGLFTLAKLLYANSVVSPLGAGLVYVTSTARIVHAMSKMGYLPNILSRLNRQQLPLMAILINFIVGSLAFFQFPGWKEMVNFLVSTMVITYAMGPVALLCLRYSLPEQKRPFKLPAANFFCFLAFFCCNLFSYWTGWETISKLAIALIIGVLLFIIAFSYGKVKVQTDNVKPALWIIPYLLGLITISYCGAFGGKNYIPFGWDFLVMGVFSAIILNLAVRSRMLHENKEVVGLFLEEAFT